MLFAARLSPNTQATIRSQGGPGAGMVLMTCPMCRITTIPPQLFRVTLLRRLRLPLHLTVRVNLAHACVRPNRACACVMGWVKNCAKIDQIGSKIQKEMAILGPLVLRLESVFRQESAFRKEFSQDKNIRAPDLADLLPVVRFASVCFWSGRFPAESHQKKNQEQLCGFSRHVSL